MSPVSTKVFSLDLESCIDKTFMKFVLFQMKVFDRLVSHSSIFVAN